MTSYEDRLARALSLHAETKDILDLAINTANDDAAEWLRGVDRNAYVGSIHHTVPRFLLERWSRRGQVQTYSRIEDRIGTRNVRDFGYRDFYTFVADDGLLDSTIESLLGRVESPAKEAMDRILSTLRDFGELTPREQAAINDFAIFQIARTGRRRREIELQAEYFAKTLSSDQVADTDLRQISIVPHQNDSLRLLNVQITTLWPLIAYRPLEVLRLSEGHFLLGDEPLVVNGSESGVHHHADCFLSDEDFSRRLQKEKRKKLHKRKDVKRVVHMYPTQGHGIGVAEELVLPISPRTALYWGALMDARQKEGASLFTLGPDESRVFANSVNAIMLSQALDWVIDITDSTCLASINKPPLEPLLKVCSGSDAAAAALNEVPRRLRPHRLRR